MTTLEKIKSILIEYGNASLSYGMELRNGDWIKCDPRRGLFWYCKLHNASSTNAGYTEEVINEKDESFLQGILKKLKKLALYEEHKAYWNKVQNLQTL